MEKGKADVDAQLVGEGPDGSIIAEQYAAGLRKRGLHGEESASDEAQPVPTNAEVVQEVQKQLRDSVDTVRNYGHVACYTLFVGLYMLVLYFQAAGYQSGGVVSTLRAALVPDGGSTLRFSSERQVLAFLGNRLLAPIWTDPVCGDGKCEAPWEQPAWGRFGCRADCGVQPKTRQVMVAVLADFTGHPTLSPSILMANALWNVCMRDPARRERGQADLCWFAEAQAFTQPQQTQIRTLSLLEGEWYVQITGDYAGRVAGQVYDVTDGVSDAPHIDTQPPWQNCKLQAAQPVSAASQALRRLMSTYTATRRLPAEAAASMLHEAIQQLQVSLQPSAAAIASQDTA